MTRASRPPKPSGRRSKASSPRATSFISSKAIPSPAKNSPNGNSLRGSRIFCGARCPTTAVRRGRQGKSWTAERLRTRKRTGCWRISRVRPPSSRLLAAVAATHRVGMFPPDKAVSRIRRQLGTSMLAESVGYFREMLDAIPIEAFSIPSGPWSTLSPRDFYGNGASRRRMDFSTSR